MSIKQLLVLLVATNAPVFLASAAPAYVASFAAPAATGQIVSSDRLWACEGATCLAGGAATSPAKHICVRLAEQVGPVTAFTARGRAFTPDEVTTCNERAGRAPVSAAK